MQRLQHHRINLPVRFGQTQLGNPAQNTRPEAPSSTTLSMDLFQRMTHPTLFFGDTPEATDSKTEAVDSKTETKTSPTETVEEKAPEPPPPTPIEQLVSALCNGKDETFNQTLKSLNEQGLVSKVSIGNNPNTSLYRLIDQASQAELILVQGFDPKQPETPKHLFWFDFHSDDNPLLETLSKRFSFHTQHSSPDGTSTSLAHEKETPQLSAKPETKKWRERLPLVGHHFKTTSAQKQDLLKTDLNGPIKPVEYETPSIDNDNFQVTLYSLVSEYHQNSTNQIKIEPLRLFAGKDFLITIHGAPNSSADKARELLLKSPKYKTPAELLDLIFTDVINRYDPVLDLLDADLAKLANMLKESTSSANEKKLATTVNSDILSVLGTIGVINRAFRKQERVINDLLELNKFHSSEFIKNEDYKEKLEKLESKKRALNEFQEQYKTLLDNLRAISNDKMNVDMKKLTTLTAAFAPPTLVAGLMGQNVPLPLQDKPGIFFIYSAIGWVASFGLMRWIKKK